MILVLASCTQEVLNPKEIAKENVTDDGANARTPEGSGTGSGTTPGSVGFAMSYIGGGKWVGGLGGSPVWFWGPTPTELKNGIQGEFPVTCPPGSANCMYADGFIAYGSGSGFTVIQPMCGGSSSTTVTMNTVNIVRKYVMNADGTYALDPAGNRIEFSRTHEWGTRTRNVTSLSSTNCKLVYNGKVIINANCMPIIVDIDSDLVNLCSLSGKGGVILFD